MFFSYSGEKKILEKKIENFQKIQKKIFDFFFLKNEGKNQTFETLGLF